MAPQAPHPSRTCGPGAVAPRARKAAHAEPWLLWTDLHGERPTWGSGHHAALSGTPPGDHTRMGHKQLNKTIASQ